MSISGADELSPSRIARVLAVIYPPPRFAPEIEEQYQQSSNSAARPVRQASLWLVLVLWLVSMVGDQYHHLHGGFELSELLEGARIVGVVAVIIAIVAMRRTSAPAVAILNGVCLALYTCALVTVLAVGLGNLFFYFISLVLVMLLMFGPFRLPARSVATLLVVELILTYAVLNQGEYLLTVARVGDAKTYTDLSSSISVSTRLTKPGAVKQKADESLTDFLTAAELYLLAFAIVGMVIAVERERLSRQTFVRERELSDNLLQLEASQRSAAAKTAALTDAQGALKDDAERRNAEKTVFLRDLAHDLRNALAVVVFAIASTRDALRRGDAFAGEAALDNAGHASRLASNTLNAVMDMARLESDQVTPEYGEVELAPLLNSAVLICEPMAAARGVSIRLRTGPAGVTVRSDATLLARMIGNLLVNAVKYSDPDKGERQSVLLGAVVYARRVRVDVVDNGLGIAENDQPRIWQPFVQLDNPQRDRERGVGLGLSIVRGIAERLEQHRIEMKSAAGLGTRFSIDLPRTGDVVPSATPSTGAEQMVQLSRSYLVMVEDDSQVREAILGQLRRTGMLCDGFASYGDLAAELDDIERRPDLILTDYRLPELRTGEDVIALLRERFDRDLPAVLLTGELGPFDFARLPGERPRVLQKPIETDALINELLQALPPAVE